MSRANGWYFVRIDDEWRPAEWFDGDWDLSPMMALLILEVDEDQISIAIHAENRQLRAKVAELERQAAIGRRAVEMLSKHQHSEDISLRASYCPECDKMQPEHAEGCELAAILRDDEQAGMGVEQ